VLPPDYYSSQEGTIHFRYLLSVAGGLLHTSRTLPEHFAQLNEALTSGTRESERSRRFVEAFVRPHGLEVAATARFADTVEALGRAGRVAPYAPPRWWHAPVRAALTPLLASSGERGFLADERADVETRVREERLGAKREQHEIKARRRDERERAKVRRMEEWRRAKSREKRTRGIGSAAASAWQAAVRGVMSPLTWLGARNPLLMDEREAFVAARDRAVARAEDQVRQEKLRAKRTQNEQKARRREERDRVKAREMAQWRRAKLRKKITGMIKQRLGMAR
jgi:hypothetical protein